MDSLHDLASSCHVCKYGQDTGAGTMPITAPASEDVSGICIWHMTLPHAALAPKLWHLRPSLQH